MRGYRGDFLQQCIGILNQIYKMIHFHILELDAIYDMWQFFMYHSIYCIILGYKNVCFFSVISIDSILDGPLLNSITFCATSCHQCTFCHLVPRGIYLSWQEVVSSGRWHFLSGHFSLECDWQDIFRSHQVHKLCLDFTVSLQPSLNYLSVFLEMERRVMSRHREKEIPSFSL